MTALTTEEQDQIRNEARRVLAKSCDHHALRGLLEARGDADERFWSVAVDMGWPAMTVAEEAGGLGLSTVDALIVAEECGRALAGAPFLATAFAAAHALYVAGDQSTLLKALAVGKTIGAIAFAEGSEPIPAGPRTRITEGRLTGEKPAVLGAARADFAIVLASNDDDRACITLVDLAAEGVTRMPLDTIDNSRCVATLRFRGAAATILPVDDPRRLARDCLGRLALHLAAEAVGGTDACIALACGHANQRQAFGQAIGKFQAVKHAIAEMYVANEMARATVLDAAVRCDQGDDHVEASIGAARLNAIHGYEAAAAGTTQIHGGIGVTWEADVHLHYRRSRSLAAEAGSLAYWEDRIVSRLAAA